MAQQDFFFMRPGYEIGPKNGVVPDMAKLFDGAMTSLACELRRIDYLALPSVSVHCENFAEQLPPNTPAIYFLVHQDKYLKYIGKARNIRSRWLFTGKQFFNYEPQMIHRCLPLALELGDVRLHYWSMAEQHISVVELILISALKPDWNCRDLD
jgi:hypothetical protein